MRAGEYQSKLCCYGYKKGKNNRMEIDEEAANVVRMIFDLSLKRNSAQQIAKELYTKGILTPGEYKASKGMKGYDISRCHHMWQRSTVLRLLADERYIGTYIMGKRAVNEVGSNRVHLKDESEWFKIPDHHPAIVDTETFIQVQAGIRHPKMSERKQKKYPLRGKVFCGCCGHSMYRVKKDPEYSCRFTEISDDFPCRGLTIKERDLETVLFEVMSKQAAVILNIDPAQSLDELSTKVAEKVSYEKQIEDCYSQKMNTYERYMLNEIDLDTYQRANTAYDIRLKEIQRLHSAIATVTARMQMDRDERDSLSVLVRDVSAEVSLTQKLTEALIEKVIIFPNNQMEIVWKVQAFA